MVKNIISNKFSQVKKGLKNTYKILDIWELFLICFCYLFVIAFLMQFKKN